MTGTAIFTVLLTGLFYLALQPWAGRSRRRLRLAVAAHRAAAGAESPARNVPAIDLVVVLELLEVATGAGASIPRALEAVGEAVGGKDGAALRAVGSALVLGASWQTAWGGAGQPARLQPIGHAMRGAWENGAAPSRALRAAGEALRRDSDRRTRTAAARLGVQLVLPVGLCLLPAFVLIGLVPIFASLGLDLLRG